ncbi:MAG TPA: glycosyltransferase 87 family protein [Gaiellaceae bacterium]|nr:glycosyltransferase 87 family protein [Gaiellaceae bacterium]
MRTIRARSSPPAEPAFVAAAALAAAAVFLASWAALGHGPWARDRIVDTPVYEGYGAAIARGEVPYRDFRPEYPPAALPAFALPALLQEEPGHDAFARVFSLLMAVCGVAAVAAVAVSLRLLRAPPARVAAALGLVAVSPLLLGSVVLSRYDLWPAALAAAATAAFLAGRDRLGAGVLGLAVAAKIYPAVLAPLALAWVWRRRGRREALVAAGVFAAVVAVCFAPFLVVAPEGVAASLWRQLSRPLQIESLGAAAAIVLHNLGLVEVEMVGSHGSQNLAGTPGAAIGVVHTLVQGAALAAVWIGFARGEATPERLARYAALGVVVFVASGKVLSPQFLIWLVPLVPLVAGRRGLAASALLVAALVLTQLWFPFRYWDYAREFDQRVAVLVLARDLVLVSLAATLAARVRPGRAPARS